MKKYILYIFCFIALNLNAQLKLLNNGNFGIGTLEPDRTLVVNGPAKINGNLMGGSTHGALRIETEYKWVDIGCDHYSNDHIHFKSNVDHGYYFDKGIEVVGGRYSSFTGPLILATQRKSKVFVLTNGNVGIANESPSYKLDVNGDIAANGVIRISADIRYLKEIENMRADKISKLYMLEAKTYLKANSKLKSSHQTNQEYDSASVTIPVEASAIDTIAKIGFLAHELKEFFPELVSEDSQGYLNIDYLSLLPVLVEALKEQHKRILKLEKQTEYLKRNTSLNEIQDTSPFLSQNKPNPFKGETHIEIILPSNISDAKLFIYDLSGRQIKNLEIKERERVNIQINAAELEPGMYKYALMADGQLVGTETMILTK